MSEFKRSFYWACSFGMAALFLLSGCGANDLTGSRHQLPQHDKGDVVVELSRGVKMAFMAMPPGTFLMGAPETEAGSSDLERPQHQVTFTRSFYMGKYEVTQGQWFSLMDGEVPEEDFNKPVTYQSWRQIARFMDGMNALLGGKYTVRLPTEAEWEYACRAGTTTTWWFGDAIPEGAEVSDYMVVNRMMFTVYRFNIVEDVGSTLPNPWRLYDMHGNVAEVCGLYGEESGLYPIHPYQWPPDRARFLRTTYSEAPQIDPEYRDPAGRIDIMGQSGLGDWVSPFPVRGGSSRTGMTEARSANRRFTNTNVMPASFFNDGVYANGPIGFRLVLIQH